VSVYDHPFPADEFVQIGGHLSLDPLACLGALAESTDRVRLMTNVFVLPYRSPYIAAGPARANLIGDLLCAL
jgi:alkanesulfonate monooxygenase SsuD/methylene tetrahydromethanopterin reductase-like flavin-dependent oxidoreductase (luciferase family)